MGRRRKQRHANALEKARTQLDKATGAQVEKLEGLVDRLEQEWAAAIDRKARSIARAQLTKSGHVMWAHDPAKDSWKRVDRPFKKMPKKKQKYDVSGFDPRDKQDYRETNYHALMTGAKKRKRK